MHAPAVQVADVSGRVRHQPLQSGQQLVKVAVLASAFLLSVVLGNVSLRFIPVSFSQVECSATCADMTEGKPGLLCRTM